MEERKESQPLTEKEYYKDKIIDKIKNIDNVWILSQIARFVENVTRGGIE